MVLGPAYTQIILLSLPITDLYITLVLFILEDDYDIWVLTAVGAPVVQKVDSHIYLIPIQWICIRKRKYIT